ncbi:MAG TPA: hypothetical protein VLI39_07570 [Sedimentisphaerales bacterium]|nr:hypothetical protein [Sedimentisphaerales bacterium]
MCTKGIMDWLTGGGDDKKAPEAPPMPAAATQGTPATGPSAADMAMRNAQQRLAATSASAKGQGSTLLTGGAGAEGAANVKKKTLLGM